MAQMQIPDIVQQKLFHVVGHSALSDQREQSQSKLRNSPEYSAALR